MDLKGKRVTVIGLGNSGMNAALLLSRHGARVSVTDAGSGAELKEAAKKLEARRINVELGGHTEAFVKGSDLVVVSPGVEESSESLKWAIKHKIEIISEMELGYRFCKGRIIAITGTNGKSTVTTLIGEILKSGGRDTVVCGNIGNSLCGEVSKIKKDTWVVLEVSSAQLERVDKFKPHIAIILNVTDDHMDRYKNFYEYFNYKMRIFANQGENNILILNYDAENLRRLKGLARSSVLFYAKARPVVSGYDIAAYVKDEWICCLYGGSEKEIMHVNDIKLKGAHNLENVMASSLTGVIAGVTERSIRDTVRNFTGLEHRFETVALVEGDDVLERIDMMLDKGVPFNHMETGDTGFRDIRNRVVSANVYMDSAGIIDGLAQGAAGVVSGGSIIIGPRLAPGSGVEGLAVGPAGRGALTTAWIIATGWSAWKTLRPMSTPAAPWSIAW